MIDSTTGAAVQQIDYDVWGNITGDTDPGFQPFAFAGGLYDAATGLVHFGARDCDPETGRWISRDPILFAGGDANVYRYVADSPADFVDAGGLNAAIQDLNDAREGQGLPPLKPPELPEHWHLTITIGAQGLLATLGLGGYVGVGFDSAGHVCFLATAIKMAGLGLFGEAGVKVDVGTGVLCPGVSHSVGPFGFYGEVGGSAQYANGHLTGETAVAGPGAGYAVGVAAAQTIMYCFRI